MLCSLVDIVPAGSSADRAAKWSKEAVEAFASMIGNKAILLTVCQVTTSMCCTHCFTSEYYFAFTAVTCGSVAEWLGCWTCDQQVAVSNSGLPVVKCNPGQVVNTHVPLSPSSIILFRRHCSETFGCATRRASPCKKKLGVRLLVVTF